MASGTAKTALASVKTLADLLERLGRIPLERIRFHPFPGTAKERDVIAAHSGLDRQLCELIDGVLVEKAMGAEASRIAMLLGYYLQSFLEGVEWGGVVLGADGFIKLKPSLIRGPDASYFSAERLPGGELPDEAITTIIPDLVAEVLSPSNTKKEMQMKVREYFESGVRLVWIIDAKTATTEVCTAPTACKHVGKNGTLEGGDVLPGFTLPLRKLFARKPPKKPRS